MEPWLDLSAGTWRSSSLPLMFFCRRSSRYQQWIIFHKSGSSHLQPEASSGLPEKSFRVRSKRDGGDEGGGNDEDLVQLYLTRLLTHYSEYHDMTLWWHELHIFQKRWHFHSAPRERWPIIQSWSLFSNPTTPTLKRSSPRSKRSRYISTWSLVATYIICNTYVLDIYIVYWLSHSRTQLRTPTNSYPPTWTASGTRCWGQYQWWIHNLDQMHNIRFFQVVSHVGDGSAGSWLWCRRWRSFWNEPCQRSGGTSTRWVEDFVIFFSFFGRSFGEKPNSVEASMLSLDR